MTTKELHEAKLIERAFDGLLKGEETKRLPCQPAPFWFFDKGYRDGYDEGLKRADNKKQIAAALLRDMLQLHQEQKRGMPTFDELVLVLRLVEGDTQPLMPSAEVLAESHALAALRKLRDVVTARNREGMDWGEHFGALMSALCHAGRVLPEVDKNVVTGAELDRLQGRTRLISRLQACVDDPMWPDHAEVSKKLLEACLSALVNPLDGDL